MPQLSNAPENLQMEEKIKRAKQNPANTIPPPKKKITRKPIFPREPRNVLVYSSYFQCMTSVLVYNITGPPDGPDVVVIQFPGHKSCPEPPNHAVTSVPSHIKPLPAPLHAPT